MAKSGMNKEVAIRYTGDTKDFKRAAADAKRIIKDQADQIKAKNAEMNSSFTKVTSVAKTAAAAMVAVFSVRAIVNFTKESMKLAAEAEGVVNAYSRLGAEGVNVLKDIKRATRDAIDESDLMAMTLKAASYNVPLKDLAKYLEFSTNKALELGLSVKEMASVMVSALGGQSSRALKQLGLSTTEVKNALAETGNILPLITKKLAEMGVVADTAAIRQEKIAASVQNLKEAWGGYLNQSSAVEKLLDGTASMLKQLADPELNFWQKLMFSGKQYEAWQKTYKPGKNTGISVGGFEDLMRLGIGAGTGKPVVAAPVIGPYDDLVKKIKEGAEESRKMAEAWKIIHKEIAGAGVPKGGITGVIPSIGTGLPTVPGLQAYGGTLPGQQMTEGWEAQLDLVTKLQGALEGMASAAMDGGNVLKKMADVMIDSIKRIAAELIAKAAIFGLLKLLFPGLFIEMDLFKKGSFGKFISGGLIGGKSIAMASQSVNVGGQFVLKGADAYAMVNRHNNMLYGST